MKKQKKLPIITRIGNEWDTQLFTRKPIPTITRSQLAIETERAQNRKRRTLCLPKEEEY